MSEYSKKLLDPRWQKKRLKILERDNFTCRLCGRDCKTLNVHHLKYKNEPWEIDDEFLITYCEDCHAIVEHYKGLLDIKKIISIHGTDRYWVFDVYANHLNTKSRPKVLFNVTKCDGIIDTQYTIWLEELMVHIENLNSI